MNDGEYWDLFKDVNREFRSKYCLHSEAGDTNCRVPFVKAHTVQRSILSQIAKQGHVYGVVTNGRSLKQTGGKVKLELVGIKSASTFTGMCSGHDDSVFAPLEKEAFRGTTEQCFLLCYRSILREVFAKRAAERCISKFDRVIESKPESEREVLREFKKQLGEGIRRGLKVVEKHKGQLDEMFVNRDFEAMRFAIIGFERTPDVMMSSAWHPTSDFDGNFLANIKVLGQANASPHLLSCSILGGISGGFCVMGWHESADVTCEELVASLVRLSPKELSNALIRYAFRTSENIYAKPEWWESLAETQRQSLTALLDDAANTNMPFRSTDLVDDGANYGSWKAATLKLRVSSPDGVIEMYDTYDDGGLFSRRRDIPEEHIRIAAYFIWQKEGCPDGRDLVHWDMAIDELLQPKTACSS